MRRLFGTHLQMNLERGGGGLQHDILMTQMQRLFALNLEYHRLALTQFEDLFVKGAVAIERCHVSQGQMLLATR